MLRPIVVGRHLTMPIFRTRSSTISRPITRNMSRSVLTTRPQNWKALAPSPPPNTQTLGAQTKLPLLPIPGLAATISRLKLTLRPLAHSKEEYAAAEAKIDRFAASQAVDLHERLLQHAQGKKHWLESWWDDTGYLGYRDSVVINVSYYFGFDPQPGHLPQSPAARAASLARGAMVFRQQWKEGSLKPEGSKDIPFCMDTYRWMFDCCRVPGSQGLDWSISYADRPQNIGHIVVIRKNRIWKLDTVVEGRILSMAELEKQIQYIYDHTTKEYPGIGILTASNRDVWAKDYATLASDPANVAILETIHSSAFIISLDTSTPSPTSPVSFSRDLWHGRVRDGIPTGLQNRWVDKPVQFVVYDNAQAGIMGEHSIMDGTPTARLCDDVLEYLHNPSSDLGSAPATFNLPAPKPMDWVVSPATHKAIHEANKAAAELIDTQSLGFLLTSYGKAAIKTFGVSPDSWAQMIVQLAYRRLMSPSVSPEQYSSWRTGATYEAATTRRFYKGRTEAIRVVSSESDRWTMSMDDPSSSISERKALFDAATKTHITLAKEAGNANGVDRHLLGLKKVVREGEEMPDVFRDPLVLRSSNWVLSTSAIFSKHFPVYGWGEVVPDGFGVAYMTGYDDRLQYTITSRKEMPNAQFCEEIARAAVDLYDLHKRLEVKPKL
ncbi:acyltransferase ChoActase/COT/CPT [Hygrophoropsis aurantiaca]|uniref:Acyltransferase ChoActase/COT/CPT n=1 Tax=Hygrophoropsis aurantiaca TaxID=72124 RepID=A0ACB8AMV6_9AGAM|nr:acyltransferase ChoActase/COT/CPT [Hygrophoropsis aurantiaca]